MGVSCNHADSEKSINNTEQEDIRAFYNQLDSLKGVEDDSFKSVSIRALYDGARPELQDAACINILKITRPILLHHAGADTGLLPFYRSVAADSMLHRKNRVFASLELGNYYAHIVGNTDSAASLLQEGYKYRDVLNDSMKVRLYGVAAQIFQLRGQLQEAAQNLYQCIAYAEKIHDSSSIAGNSVNLANVYRAMGDYDKSIAVRKKILTVVKDDNVRVVALQGLLADYCATGQLDSARFYGRQTEALFSQGIKHAVAEYYLYLTMGGMYVTLKHYDSSAIYFDKAKKLLPLFNDERQNMLFTITSSVGYSNIRDVRKEAAMIEGYIPQFFADGNLQAARDAYYSLYNISLKQNLKDVPIEYYLTYDSIKTLLADNENREYVAEMESKYESQKKALTIQVQQRELERRKTINTILVLSIVIIALGSSFFMARLQLLRSRKEGKLQLQFTQSLLKNTEDERRRIAAELHDGISHELLSLKNNLRQGAVTTENKIDAIIKDIRMISRNLHPVMLDQIGLEHTVQYLCEQVMNSGRLFASADIEYRNQLAKDEELQLYRIIQECVTNALKYAEAHAVKIIIETHADHLFVSIMDNGKGFDVDETRSTQPAFGLNSIIQRGKSLGGEVVINSSEQGTVIHLQIPVKSAVDNHS